MSQSIENEEDNSGEGAEFSEDLFESMLDGTFEEEASEDESVEEDAEDTAGDEDDSEHQEDTDLEVDEEADEELDEDGDGDLDEDSDDDEDDEEEDSLVEDDDLDDEDDDTEEDEDEADEAEESEDEDIDDESEDDTETDETSDGEAQETDVVDYKAFYDAVVNTEFTVNGRKSKGFSDPQKIIQSMQMAGGFSDKMAGFKKYRPFMSPLKERGMLEDQTKFDLAMNIIDGDKEAIKQHLATLSIDPMDFDMEAINYSGKSTAATAESLVVDDAVERAKSGGYEDRFRKVIGTDWDNESFSEFVSNAQVRSDLLDHMESGAYDKVQDKIAEMGRLDFNGAFGNMNSIQKYRTAVAQLQQEAPAPVQEAAATGRIQAKAPAKKKASVSTEKARIKKERAEVKYKKEVEAKNAKVAAQRKRAASMSKKKPKAKPTAKFDPMKVEGQDFDDLMDHLISGGRG